MDEQNKSPNLKTHASFIITHIIIAAVLIVIAVFGFNLISPYIDGVAIAVIAGVVLAILIYVVYFFIETKVTEHFDEPDTNFGIVLSFVFKVLVAVIIIVYSIYSGMNSDNTIGYKSGDYSEYSCYDCGKPADGGRYHLLSRPDQYFCYEHYSERKQKSDEYDAKKEADKYKVTCGLCEKKFDKYSLDGKNIIKDKYCVDCEARLIGFDNAWGD